MSLDNERNTPQEMAELDNELDTDTPAAELLNQAYLLGEHGIRNACLAPLLEELNAYMVEAEKNGIRKLASRFRGKAKSNLTGAEMAKRVNTEADKLLSKPIAPTARQT